MTSPDTPKPVLHGIFKTLAIFLAFCCPSLAANARASEMTVSAAASLANAFTELKDIFEKSHPGLVVHTNYAASNPLLRQIVEGAPVDVFASADQQTMDKAVEAGVVDPASRKNFAANTLALVVPKGAPKPAKPGDLPKLESIAIGDPASVPAGRYARGALERSGLYEKIKDKFILGSSVRQVLDYVARGEVDAGFVYGTDALIMPDKVEIAFIASGRDPDDGSKKSAGDSDNKAAAANQANPGRNPISYPIAVATTGDNREAGRAFLDFVLSPQGQAVLAKYGFSAP